MKEQPTRFQYLLALVTFPLLLAIIATLMNAPAKSIQGDLIVFGSGVFAVLGIIKIFSFWNEYGARKRAVKPSAEPMGNGEGKGQAKNEQAAVLTEDGLPLGRVYQVVAIGKEDDERFPYIATLRPISNERLLCRTRFPVSGTVQVALDKRGVQELRPLDKESHKQTDAPRPVGAETPATSEMLEHEGSCGCDRCWP